MENSLGRPYDARTQPPTAKEKNSVQRSVNSLLDTLAPERTTTRADRAPVPVEQHRTPTGCVLQAPTAALTVRWFADTSNDAAFGELHVCIWRGVVSRRGSTPTPDGASHKPFPGYRSTTARARPPESQRPRASRRRE